MRTHARLIPLLATLALACHPGNVSTATDGDGSADAGDASGASEVADAPAKPRDRSVTIARGPTHTPHEVELDPRGEVALTLDTFGHLRIWPAIRTGDAAQAAPYELPIEEPLWMAIAQADDGFVVAVIDTTNTGHVYGVSPNPDRSAAKLSPLFSLAPDDPLLELHALDGGQRFLALGVDHRVRLYDRSGAIVSVLDQRSFAPWQLRVVHAEAGAPPKLAAILAQPPRVQLLELRDDELRIASEPRTIALDRGPNRGDLVLSPDGKTVAGLRRKSGRGREFSVELIDLETDARRLVAGKSDTTIRPRMHFVDPERILLETGSSAGNGVWVEVAKAEPLAEPADADPESKLAKRLHATKHDMIPLVASAEHRPEFFEAKFDPPWDHGERLHASVVAGVRVNIERDPSPRLIVDPLASDRHFVFTPVAPRGEAQALDRTGAHVAVVDGATLWVERVDTRELVGEAVEHGLRDVWLVRFADDQRVLAVDHKGAVKLIDWQAGQIVGSTKLESTWVIEDLGFRPTPGGGVLGWRGSKPSDPVRLLSVANGALGEVQNLARDQRPAWLEILELGDAEAGALFGMSEDEADDRVDEYTSSASGVLLFTERNPRTRLTVLDGGKPRSIPLSAGQARVLALSPDASKIAIVQFRFRDDGRREDHLLSMIDVASGERLWTVGFPGPIAAPAWSGDGKRILERSQVRDAATGELVGASPSAKLVIDDRADADFARQRTD